MTTSFQHSVLLVILACSVHACERERPSAPAAREREQPRPLYEGRAEQIVFPGPSAEDLPEIGGVTYLEVVTGDVDPDAPLPMIVVVAGHGLHGRAMQHLMLVDHDTGAAAYDAPTRWMFVGPPTGWWFVPGAPEWRATWSPSALPHELEARALNAMIEARTNELAAVIATLVERRPTNGRPIVTGFWDGGTLVWALAVAHGELFTTAIPVSGSLPRPFWPKARQREISPIPSIIAIDDYRDSEQFSALVSHLLELGCAVEYHTHPDVGPKYEPMLGHVRTILREQTSALAL